LKTNIAYVGFSEEIVQLLLKHTRFQLVSVVWLKGREIAEETLSKLKENKIPFYEVSNKDELLQSFTQINCKNILMYKFSIIFPPQLVETYQIFNIHPGNMRTNRGPHPVVWTILQREKETRVSLHKINEHIDQGLLVSEAVVEVDENDNIGTLEMKINNTIPLLLEKLHSYIEGSLVGTVIEGGKYRRRIQESDYTIQIEKDSLEEISAKIRSQSAYKGAVLFVNGMKFYVSDVERQ